MCLKIASGYPPEWADLNGRPMLQVAMEQAAVVDRERGSGEKIDTIVMLRGSCPHGVTAVIEMSMKQFEDLVALVAHQKRMEQTEKPVEIDA